MRKALKRPPNRATAETDLQTYKLTLSYDGTDFKGWQRQPRERTVQGVLENAIFKITRKRIVIHGSGRTDAGVHAEGQTAHFKALLSLDTDELFRALNAILPADLRVVSVERAKAGFHARKSALSKTYRYRILNSPQVSPFHRRYVLHRPSPLDLRAMRKAASLFIRKADFTAFSSNRDRLPTRRVFLSRIQKKGDEIHYLIEADGFLRYMVRTIVGTLLEVGRGMIEPQDIEDIFRRKERALAGPTAPAKGLCLIKVTYPLKPAP